LEIRNLASIIGAEELSESDRRYMDFASAFEQRFVGQGEDEDRGVQQTLDLAWEILSLLPPEELSRVSEHDLAKRHRYEPQRREAAA
jgi:V/A-type H+-transporting ATPase subunit B